MCRNSRRREVRVFVILLSSLAMLSTLLGGLVAVFGQRRIHLVLALGSGMMLGATFLDLLPESLEAAAHTPGMDARTVLAYLLAGFLTFYLIERLLILHACSNGGCENEAHRHAGRLGSLGLIVHSTLDGVAIGAAAAISWQEGLLVALAVTAHDSGDGLNTMLLVTRGEKPRRSDYLFLLMDALAPVCGAALAFTLSKADAHAWLPIFLAVASGSFLYAATSDLLPEAHKRSPSAWVFLMTLAGVGLMALAGKFIGL